MKIIRKHQQGGIVYTPISRELFEWPPKQAAQTSSQEGKADKTVESAIVKTLEENGIPVDVDYFLSQAESFLHESSNIFSRGQTSNTIAQLTRIRSLANKVRHNNELFGKAAERLRSENTGADVALTNDGKVYVYDNDDEKIKKISISGYSDNRDRYTALTNDQLLNFREHSSNLMFDESILHDISNSIGMKTIMDQVIGTIKKLGNVEQTGQTSSLDRNLQEGLKALIEGGPDGYYSITTKDSKASENILLAVKHLYRSLNSNAKNVLRATTAAEGKDPDDIRSVYEVLTDAIFAHTDMTRSSHYIKDFPTDKSGRSGSGPDSDASLTAKEIFGDLVSKNGGLREPIKLTLPGGNVKFIAQGYRYNQVPVFGKQAAMTGPGIATESYGNLVSHGLVDTGRQAYFGDIPVNLTVDGQDIMLDNNSGASVVYLPVIDGQIDFNMVKQMTRVQERIVKEHISSPAEQERVWNEEGFVYDKEKGTGVPPYHQLKRYWVQQGHTSTEKGIIDNKAIKNSDFITREDDDILTNFASIYNSNPENKNKPKYELTPGGWIHHAYTGMILIPINDNKNEILTAGQTAYMQKPYADRIKAEQDMLYQNNQYDIVNGVYNNRSLQGNTTLNSLD